MDDTTTNTRHAGILNHLGAWRDRDRQRQHADTMVNQSTVTGGSHRDEVGPYPGGNTTHAPTHANRPKRRHTATHAFSDGF